MRIKILVGIALVIIVVIQFSCKQGNENPKIVGEELLKLFSIGDSSKLFNIYGIKELDSNLTEAERIEEIFKQVDRPGKEDIREVISKFSGKPYKIFSIDTGVSEVINIPKYMFSPSKSNCRCIVVRFKIDTSYYNFHTNYSYDSLHLLKLNNFNMYNIFEACENQGHYNRIANSNKSQTVEFLNLVWSAERYPGKSFTSGLVKIKNNTLHDIDFIKFRIILYDRKRKSFFNQTISAKLEIPSGDISQINIPGLQGYYAGFKINEDGFSWDATIIEISPEQELEFNFCKELSEIKALDFE